MVLKNSSKVVCALLGLLMVVSLVPSVTASADAPTWENGQEWAWGGEVSLDPQEGGQMDQIEQLVNTIPGATLDHLSADGTLKSYVYCHVVNQTDSEYLLEMVFAVSMSFEGDAQVTAPLQKAGTYGFFDEIPTEQKTISMNANIDVMVFERFNMTVEKSTMAIKQAISHTEVELEADVEITNIPDTEYSYPNVTYSYTSYDVSVDLQMVMDMTMTFDPYLDIYDFPLNVGDEWIVSSVAVLNGSLNGTYSASGLPDDIEAGLFQPDSGTLHYPLDLSTYTGDLGDYHVTNGVMDTETMDISAEMHCVNMTQIDNPVHGSIDVYTININENDEGTPEAVMYYSPDLKFFASMEATSEALSEVDMGDISDISPIGLGSDESLAMDSVEPDEAVDQIESISGNSLFGGSDGGDSTGGSSDMTMIFAVVMVVIVVAVIVVAMMVLRKKKP